MHLYIKLAFCVALLTDKLSQPSELRRNLELIRSFQDTFSLKNTYNILSHVNGQGDLLLLLIALPMHDPIKLE